MSSISYRFLLPILISLLLLIVTPSCFGASVAGLERRAATPSLSGGQVVFGAGTYPRATRLADSSLLGAYTAVQDGYHVLKVVISHDNGASWQAQGEVARGVGDVDNPFLLQLSSGRVLAAFRNHDRANGATGTYTFFRITICYSNDSGKTWQYLSTPASDPGSVNGNWEPFLRLSTTGTLQLYYSREVAGDDQDNLMRTSTDGGATWSTSTIVSGSGLTVRDGMIGIASTGGKNLIAVFETGINGKFTVNSVTSSDDGATWGNRRAVYAPTVANTNAGAPQVINVGGTLVASFMTDEDTVGRAWPNQAATKIVTSTDGGATWSHKTTALGVQSFWPGLVDLDASSFLVLSDYNGAKAQRVALV